MEAGAPEGVGTDRDERPLDECRTWTHASTSKRKNNLLDHLQIRVRKCRRATRWSPCWKIAPSLLEDVKFVDVPDASKSAWSLLPNSLHSFHVGASDGEQFFKEKSPFKPECAFALAVIHGGGDWYNHYRLNQEVNDQVKAEIFRKIDKAISADRFISRDEFNRFFDKRQTKEYIEKKPERFHGLLHSYVRNKAFDVFDSDENGKLDREEFDKFLYHMEREYFKYLLRVAHTAFRAFWGRGMFVPTAQLTKSKQDGGEGGLTMLRAMVSSFGEGPVADRGEQYAEGARLRRPSYLSEAENLGRALSQKDPSAMTATPLQKYFHVPRSVGQIFPPGFWSDLNYYSANNHPLHGIFMCDRFHPLDWKERVMMELSTWCSTWFALWVMGATKGYAIRNMFESLFPGCHELLFSLVFVTLPGIAWWYLLYFLFTMPCANINEADSTRMEIKKEQRIRWSGELTGYLLVVISLILPFTSGLIDQHVPESTIADAVGKKDHPRLRALAAVLVGRGKGYVIAWLMMALLYFNPLVAFGDPNPLGESTVLRLLSDTVALGQWRIERTRFQALCAFGLWELERKEGSLSGRLAAAGATAADVFRKLTFAS